MSRSEGRLRGVQGSWLRDLTGRHPRSRKERAAIFEAPPQGTVEDRWHVYTSGYLARLMEALENDYPATRRILGEGPFRSLTARYVADCPPRSFDIGRAGDRLADFLDSCLLSLDLPFLPDLARFEWSLAEAFIAPDGDPLTWADLAALGPEAVAETTLRWRPGVALIRSPWPLFDLWNCQHVADESVSLPLEGRPCNALVWRRALEVRRHVVEDADAAFLERAARGLRLADLAEEVGEGTEDMDRLVGRFRRWVEEGLFEKPQTPPTAAS